MKQLIFPSCFCRSILVLALLLTACGKETSGDSKKSEQRPGLSQAVAPNSSGVRQVRPIEFPKDEGAHYEQPIEWWYLNAQLVDNDGKKYAFFITVLSTGRHLVSLFDKANDKVYTKDYYESLNAAQNFQSVKSASLTWAQDGAPFHYKLSYSFEGLVVDLAIKANKKPFLPGGDGFITMGKTGTSHYYAFTDLTVSGLINTGTHPATVTGSGWFDHQWGKWNWAEDFHQWKWYGVKLDNGVDLMLFNFYKDRHLISSYCGYMDASGQQFHQIACDLVTREYFHDPNGGKWQKVVELQLPGLTKSSLVLASERDQQFIETNVLWEGSMKVDGTFKGERVTGAAYGELNRPD